MCAFLKPKQKSSSPRAEKGTFSMKDRFFHRKSRSRTSVDFSGSNNGQDSVVTASPLLADTQPNAGAVNQHHHLSPHPINNQDDTSQPSLSNGSIRSTSLSSQPHHRRQSSSASRKRHVRFPSQEHAAAAEGTIRLNASHVRCTFIVAYHQVSDATNEESRYEQLTVDYEEDAAFDELHAIATEVLVKKYKRTAEAYYLKVGRFRLVRDDTQLVAARGILERKDEWSEDLPQRIHAFRGQNFKVDFHIDIEWEYSSLHIEQVHGYSYAETIRKAIESKVRTNWEEKLYVPRKDLQQLMTKDTISKLVLEDESLQSPEALLLNSGRKIELDQLMEAIYQWAARLLAWCVYSRLRLVCLYHMLQRDLKDENLPLTIGDCPDEAYLSDFRIAVNHSGGFAAHTFVRNFDRNEQGLVDHQQLHDEAVVPILFDIKDPACLLGKGSFGVVYRVRIDRDHHFFSDRDDEYFAFKKFYELDAHVATKVEAESEVLAKLADAPHPNITTHLASWKRKNICFMLFRCADFNLRKYMASQPSPTWNDVNLHAIISQMAGLADALRHIHNMGPANLQPDDVQEKGKPGHRRLSQAGYHHDLKPGNILVSINKDNGALTFSISDFGSAKIGQILSGSERPSLNTRNPHPGDIVYGAPDALLEEKVSRPYDIWSMGCILLELLTWMVGIEGNTVRTFELKRLETIAHANGHQDTAFWYQNKSGVLLKPAVVAQLKTLKEHCKGRGVFSDMVNFTGKLLNVQTRERPDASQLSNAFKAIMLQLQQDLKNKDFYLSELPPRVTIAAPPTPIGEHGGLSRTPSVNESPAIARTPGTLSPNLKTNRRSTVASIQTNIGPRNAGVHTRHFSDSDVLQRPSQLQTEFEASMQSPSPADSESQEAAPNTPRISLSDYDDDDRDPVQL